jgi:outer membrane protein, multidrug efflux system
MVRLSGLLGLKLGNIMLYILVVTLFGFINSGCTFHSKAYKPPAVTVPDTWHTKGVFPVPKGVILGVDSKLRSYLDQSLGNNFSLCAMGKNLSRAEAMRVVKESGRYPQIKAGVNCSKGENRLGEDESFAGKSYEPWGSVSWEVDLWAKIRDRSQAARSEYLASEANYRAAYLSISSQIAKAWDQAIADKLLYKHASEVAKSYQTILEAVEERYLTGLTEGLEVYIAETAVSQALTNLQASKVESLQAIRIPRVLSGDYPD